MEVASLKDGENGYVTEVDSLMEDEHVTEVVSLMEGEWSFTEVLTLMDICIFHCILWSIGGVLFLVYSISYF